MTEQTLNQENLPVVAAATEVDKVQVLQIVPTADESQSSDSPWLAVPGSGVNTTNLEDTSQNPLLEPSAASCHLCQNRRFQNSTSSLQDRHLMKPCACDFHVHHGCLVDLVETQERCLICGINYRFYKYGSKTDFFVRYWYRFALVASACLVLIGSGIYGIYLTCPPTELGGFLLLVPSCAAVIIGYNVGSHFMTWMLKEGYAKFQRKYRSIVVFRYKPEISLPTSIAVDQEVTMLDDVDSSNLINLNTSAKQNQAEEKLKTNGIMASTPCETTEPPVKFSFDTPRHDCPMTDVKKQPFSDPKRWITIYPAYLDSKRTQEQGRKIAKDKAIEAPTSAEIHQTLTAAGFNAILEPNKMYSRNQDRDPETQGRVRVQLKNDDGKPKHSEFPTRASILLHLAEMIPKLKTRQPGYVATAATATSGNKKNKKKK